MSRSDEIGFTKRNFLSVKKLSILFPQQVAHQEKHRGKEPILKMYKIF